MLFSFRSSNLSWPLIIALVRDDRRREADAVWRGPRVATTLGLGEIRLAAGGKLLGMDDPEWFKAGGGSALGAFPMPLGSLTELLRPPALPGPLGIPLTPASAAPCANDCTGDIKQPAHARAKNVDLPNIDHSPVRVSNEAAGLPFPVRMRPNAGHGLPFSRKPDHVRPAAVSRRSARSAFQRDLNLSAGPNPSVEALVGSGCRIVGPKMLAAV